VLEFTAALVRAMIVNRTASSDVSNIIRKILLTEKGKHIPVTDFERDE
jgi:hypothetical protein